MGASRASFPRFRREGTAPRIELTADDIEILRRVHRHRFIRADDIYRLFPERSRDHLSRRLAGLYRNQFLDRPIAQVDRFQEGGGSQPFVLWARRRRCAAARRGLQSPDQDDGLEVAKPKLHAGEP